MTSTWAPALTHRVSPAARSRRELFAIKTFLYLYDLSKLLASDTQTHRNLTIPAARDAGIRGGPHDTRSTIKAMMLVTNAYVAAPTPFPLNRDIFCIEKGLFILISNMNTPKKKGGQRKPKPKPNLLDKQYISPAFGKEELLSSLTPGRMRTRLRFAEPRAV